ncbi:MAG: hypothetical protein BWY91_00449 [bacterium ADurb.BinA028]|nr:MAG: hypothetical protein BWY91_00449 [bacterium ADurb.BinA028]
MGLDPVELALRHEGAHVDAVFQRRAQPHRGDRRHEVGEERVGDRLVQHHALGVHAQLSGRAEAGPDGAGDRPAQVGIRPHVEGVLAAEFQRRGHQPTRSGLGDRAADLGRAGVADIVGQVDDRLTHRRSLARHDLQHTVRQPGVGEHLGSEQGRQRRLRVGPKHHGVAGEQGGQAVADRQRERVVPRADDPHDAVGLADRFSPREDRIGPPRSLAGQIAAAGPGVVPRHEGDVGDLLEGLQPSLPGLQLHEVEQLHLTIQHEVVDPHDDASAVLDRQSRPRPLRTARMVDGHLDVGPRRARQLIESLPGHRGHHGAQLGATAGDQPPSERGHERCRDGIRLGYAARLGGGGRDGLGR